MHILKEISASVPDHQVLVSFNNDDEAYTFWEWLEMHGFAAYKEWLNSYNTQ